MVIRKPGWRGGGFTLLEVMVALAVVAIALAAVVKGAAGSARGVATLRERTLAHWVAQNKLAELHLAQAWPAIGEASGDADLGGQSWHWQMRVSSTPMVSLRRVEIRISPAAAANDVADTLVDLLARP